MKIPPRLAKAYLAKEMTGKQLAAKLGRPIWQIAYILRRDKLLKDGRGRTFTSLPDADLEAYKAFQVSVKELADKHGCCYATMQRLLKELGCVVSCRTGLSAIRSHAKARARWQAIGQQYQEGKTLRELGQQEGVSRQCIQQGIEKHTKLTTHGDRRKLRHIICNHCRRPMLASRVSVVVCPDCTKEVRHEDR